MKDEQLLDDAECDIVICQWQDTDKLRRDLSVICRTFCDKRVHYA